MSHNNQNKIAIINDISGFGRCSIAVSLPIISHMRVQGCVLPTSIFSNHTGFESFFYEDFTDSMEKYMMEWKKLNLQFEGIVTGFLGSAKQIEIVENFMKNFKDAHTKVIIDPVMGEDGKAYVTYTEEMCDKMKHLVKYADILTPNVTEACMLTGTPYKAEGWTKSELLEVIEKLRGLKAKKIVISGLVQGNYITNVVSEEEGYIKLLKQKKVGHVRSGTGDIFSAILAADCVNGVDLDKSVRKAAGFIRDCIRVTEEKNIPSTDGVCFEEVLYRLK